MEVLIDGALRVIFFPGVSEKVSAIDAKYSLVSGIRSYRIPADNPRVLFRGSVDPMLF